MSNFYCEGCKKVLNSKSERGDINGLPYCIECFKKMSVPATLKQTDK